MMWRIAQGCFAKKKLEQHLLQLSFRHSHILEGAVTSTANSSTPWQRVWYAKIQEQPMISTWPIYANLNQEFYLIITRKVVL
jgi:hypothetical protein